MKKIELDKLEKISIPVSEVTKEGQALINNKLRDEYGFNFERYSWDWSWFVPKGEYSGTLPKRIAKRIYKRNGAAPSTSFISEIGNIAMKNMLQIQDVYIDWTRTFDWTTYEFGQKDGSCYFGGSFASALEGLKDHDGYAMRFFKSVTEEDMLKAISVRTDMGIDKGQYKYKGFEGFGRVWVVPVDEDTESSYFNMFNAYGVSLTFAATIACRYLGGGDITYQEKPIHGPGCIPKRGTMYINGGRCQVIGPSELITPMEKSDWKWNAKKGDELPRCGFCHNLLEGDTFFHSECDGEIWCENCLDHSAFTCAGNGRYYPTAQQLVINHQYFSRAHANLNPYRECILCGNQFFIEHMENIVTTVNSKKSYEWVCEECMPEVEMR